MTDTGPVQIHTAFISLERKHGASLCIFQIWYWISGYAGSPAQSGRGPAACFQACIFKSSGAALAVWRYDARTVREDPAQCRPQAVGASL